MLGDDDPEVAFARRRTIKPRGASTWLLRGFDFGGDATGSGGGEKGDAGLGDLNRPAE